MSKKEKIPLRPGAPKTGDQPDDQTIIDLMEKRKLQQDALKKIITSMDKSSEDGGDSNTFVIPKPSKQRKQDQSKLI